MSQVKSFSGDVSCQGVIKVLSQNLSRSFHLLLRWLVPIAKYSSKNMEFTSYTEKTLGNKFNNCNEKQTRLGVGLEGIAVQVEKLCRENY